MEKSVLGNTRTFQSEYIGLKSHTRRSETSQYPEEEKTIVIPSVVASERGTAQTSVFTPEGCGTSLWDQLG